MGEQETGAAAEPDFPSGPWVGFYRDAGSNHRQDLRLEFAGGRMRGEGSDDIGPFVVAGRYDPESREVWWTKTYPGSHDVQYRGYREIKGIWGLWEIPPRHRDGFHIWPRSEGEAGAARTEAAEQLPVAAAPAAPVSGWPD